MSLQNVVPIHVVGAETFLGISKNFDLLVRAQAKLVNPSQWDSYSGNHECHIFMVILSKVAEIVKS